MAATQTKQDRILYPDFGTAAEQARETSDKFVDASRKATSVYLGSIEKYAHSVAQFQRKLAEQAKLEPVAGVFTAQAKLAEDLTSASINAARELVAS